MPHLAKSRRRIAIDLLERYGVPLAEIAGSVGVSTSDISKSLRG